MSKIILSFKAFFSKPLIYVYFIVSILLFVILLFNTGHNNSIFDTNIFFDISFVLFFILTYAAISGILGRLYIKKFYTSFLVFCFFWLLTMFISYFIVAPEGLASGGLYFILIANAISYTVFYGITFAISYCVSCFTDV